MDQDILWLIPLRALQRRVTVTRDKALIQVIGTAGHRPTRHSRIFSVDAGEASLAPTMTTTFM
jgi:hypothetical protein